MYGCFLPVTYWFCGCLGAEHSEEEVDPHTALLSVSMFAFLLPLLMQK